jgi:hypothetical protein
MSFFLKRFGAATSLEAVRAGVAWRMRRVRRMERRLLAEFRQFYEALPRQQDVLYLFFSTGLLHWVKTVLAFLPERCNAVLIGSDLTPDELEWLRSSQTRPLHHIASRVDDKTVWELLFEVNRHNFGWLDIDCFLIRPEVLDEMTSLASDVAMNSAYSYIGHGGRRVISTHFVFVNAAVRDAIRRTGVELSPCTYCYFDNPQGRHVPYATTRVPTRGQMALLRTLLPVDELGRPIPPSMIKEKFYAPVFDTLVLYQFLANALGYRIEFVRTLSGIAGTPESYSPELMHIAAASYFRTLRRFEHDKPDRLTDRDREAIFSYYRLLLQFNYLLLSKRAAGLPEEYLRLQEELASELRRLGIPFAGIAPTLRGFLLAMGSVDEETFRSPGWRDLWE